MKVLKKIISAVLVLGLIPAVGCGKKENSSKNIVYYNDSNQYSQESAGAAKNNNETDKDAGQPEQNTIAAQLNQPADIAGVSVNITNIYDIGKLDISDNTEVDLHTFVIVCEITNNTESELKTNSLDFSIVNIDGLITDISSGSFEMLHAGKTINDMELLNATLQPGESAKGYAAISAYSQWESIVLRYYPSRLNPQNVLTYEITKDMVEQYK